MAIEIEGRILKIKPQEIIMKLEKLGAKLAGEYNYSRYVFDVIPRDDERWVRLRSDGKKTTLTVKELRAETAEGTDEWEIEVSNLKTTLKILEKIGIKARGHQESRRREYKIDEVKFMLDEWPKLGNILEIEAQKSSDILKYAKLLGFSEKEITYKGIEKLFKEIGVDLKKIKELKFK